MRRENQKIIFVSGKGGVGKTAVAASLAIIEARRGKKVLLAELGEKSFLRHLFAGAGGAQPHAATDGLDVVRWEAESCLHEYLLHYLRVGKLVDLFFSNVAVQSLINAAPALRELALLGKITSGPRGIGPDMPYDVIVVDAFATGHFKALFMAPVGLAEAVRLGPMGEHSRQIAEIIKNPCTTKMVLVTLPEELPVNEAIDLHRFLKTRFAQNASVVVNRNLPMPLSLEELRSAREKIETLSHPPAWGLDFCDYLSEQGRRQEDAARRARELKADVLDLPFYFLQQWPDLLRAMSEDLEKKWPRA